jgi:hypothetical protein
MAKKKVMYKKKEVVYYTSCIKKGQATWLSLTLRGGENVIVEGKEAVKLLKKL